ncbi:MAG TPA: biopolymer transporter ExbD [Deltaproteobacteria bacterium]|nr:biopolymer transporter ExbD [Deltaproteobacteria bacterium]
MRLFEPRTRRPGIILTPLIDILFLLIIFFVVSSRLADESGLTLRLPESGQAQSLERTPVVVQVGADETVQINGLPVPPERIEEALTELRASEAVDLLVLQVDHRVSHGRVVQLMDSAKSAGFLRVAFGTQPAPLTKER